MKAVSPEDALRQAGGSRQTYSQIEPQKARMRKPTPITLIWFSDLRPVLDVADLVQGLLLENTTIVVFGASGSGKTFWVTDLSLCIAAGQQWNGRRVEQAGVIYVIMEGGNGFRNRVSAWRAEHCPEVADLPFAAITSPVDFLDPGADVDRLISTINIAGRECGRPVRLVVIDTLSRALAAGDENSPEDMGALVKNMDSVRARTGASVAFIHHSGKEQARGARGHSLLKAAIDTEVEIKDEGNYRSATVTKQRDLPKGEVFGFSLRSVDVGFNRHDEQVTTCIVEHNLCETLTSRRRGPTGDAKWALKILADLIGDSGEIGHPDVPPSLRSVPEQLWRERFYDRAKAGAEVKAKQKAFRRAADSLQEGRNIGLASKRVWIQRWETD